MNYKVYTSTQSAHSLMSSPHEVI